MCVLGQIFDCTALNIYACKICRKKNATCGGNTSQFARIEGTFSKIFQVNLSEFSSFQLQTMFFLSAKSTKVLFATYTFFSYLAICSVVWMGRISTAVNIYWDIYGLWPRPPALVEAAIILWLDTPWVMRVRDPRLWVSTVLSWAVTVWILWISWIWIHCLYSYENFIIFP